MKRTLYALQKLDLDQNIVAEIYFKKRKNLEYIYTQLCLVEQFPHFKAWCELRELNSEDFSAWEQYATDVGIFPTKNFQTGKAKVSSRDLRYKLYSFENIFKLSKRIDRTTSFKLFSNELVSMLSAEKMEE